MEEREPILSRGEEGVSGRVGFEEGGDLTARLLRRAAMGLPTEEGIAETFLVGDSIPEDEAAGGAR